MPHIEMTNTLDLIETIRNKYISLLFQWLSPGYLVVDHREIYEQQIKMSMLDPMFFMNSLVALRSWEQASIQYNVNLPHKVTPIINMGILVATKSLETREAVLHPYFMNRLIRSSLDLESLEATYKELFLPHETIPATYVDLVTSEYIKNLSLDVVDYHDTFDTFAMTFEEFDSYCREKFVLVPDELKPQNENETSLQSN